MKKLLTLILSLALAWTCAGQSSGSTTVSAVGGVVLLKDNNTARKFFHADTNASRGAALIRAVTAHAAGDTILMGPGTFDTGTAQLSLLAGATLRGQGWRNTIIDCDKRTNNIKVTNNVAIEDLKVVCVTPSSSDGHSVIGNEAAAYTNVTIRNCWIVGEQDIFNGWGQFNNTSIFIDGCWLETKFDIFNHTPGTGNVVWVQNTRVTANGAGNPDGSAGLGGLVCVAGCTFYSHNNWIELGDAAAGGGGSGLIVTGGTMHARDTIVTRITGASAGNDLVRSAGTLNVAGGFGTGTAGVYTSSGTVTYLNTASGNVATDAIWDTKGDIAVATGANTAIKLAVGATDGHVLTVDSTTATGLKYAAAGAGGTTITDLGDATGDGTVALAGHKTDLTSTQDAASGYILKITNTDADAANDVPFIYLFHNDGGDANVPYFMAIGDADGTPTTDFRFDQVSANFGVPLLPVTSDGAALGSATKMWADLFLASGAVINFNNGDVTLTHSADTLTVGGGTVAASEITTIDLTPTNLHVGNTDTTLTRVSAGVIAVEGATVYAQGGALGTPTSGTVTNLTGTASININGTVGATTPGTGAFTTLTTTGAVTPAENSYTLLDSVLSADGKFTGTAIPGTAGATLAFGDLIYLDPTDSRWELVDANAAAAADGDARGIIGLCVLAAAADADPTVILLSGTIRADAAFPTFTVNAPILVSETAGDVTNTSPTTEDNVVRVLGYGIDGNSMYFNPASGYIIYDAP